MAGKPGAASASGQGSGGAASGAGGSGRGGCDAEVGCCCVILQTAAGDHERTKSSWLRGKKQDIIQSSLKLLNRPFLEKNRIQAQEISLINFFFKFPFRHCSSLELPDPSRNTQLQLRTMHAHALYVIRYMYDKTAIMKKKKQTVKSTSRRRNIKITCILVL